MAQAEEFPVEKMCRVLGVSRSGYYAWRQRRRTATASSSKLKQHILNSFERSRQNYGSPRIAEDLMRQGIQTSKSSVARYMKQLSIRPKRHKKYVRTTQSKHHEPIAEDLLKRDFEASQPAQKWVSDITYLSIRERWYFLTVIIDLADRTVVGWVISDNLSAQHSSMAAYRRALGNRRPNAQTIFHSDRGVQYACQDFRRLLKEQGCQQSMSRKGNCWDNAVAESFFKTIKTECIYKHTFQSVQEARAVIFDYIDGWYNTLRIHTSLGGQSPRQAYLAMTANYHTA